MRRGNWFWGLLLVLGGALLLLQNLGIVSINAWGIFWPLAVILLGLFLLSGFFFHQSPAQDETLNLPLDNASKANIRFNHGAGSIHIAAGSDSTSLLAGTFSGGIENQQRREGSAAFVELSTPSNAFWDAPWMGGYTHGFIWDVTLNSSIPLDLEFKTGASESRFDLTGLRVNSLRLETGASSTSVIFPEASGFTHAQIKSGIASVDMTIPQSVSAHIEVKGGMMGLDIDNRRFHQFGSTYESPDYATAQNKVELLIDSGVGSIQIR
jgi:hypothetical protein